MKLSIVKHKDKRSGITYVYESESYWDKDKKQPRSKRTLIGKLNEETGEIIPTGKSGRKKNELSEKEPEDAPVITEQVNLIAQKDAKISELKAENTALKKELDEIKHTLTALLERFKD